MASTFLRASACGSSRMLARRPNWGMREPMRPRPGGPPIAVDDWRPSAGGPPIAVDDWRPSAGASEEFCRCTEGAGAEVGREDEAWRSRGPGLGDVAMDACRPMLGDRAAAVGDAGAGAGAGLGLSAGLTKARVRRARGTDVSELAASDTEPRCCLALDGRRSRSPLPPSSDTASNDALLLVVAAVVVEEEEEAEELVVEGRFSKAALEAVAGCWMKE